MIGSQPIKVNEGKSFDAVPDDKYQLQIMKAEAVMQMNFQGTQEEERLKFTFSILDPDKKMKSKDASGAIVENPLRGRKLWARFSKNLTAPGASKLSNLTKFVNALYGRELKKEELDVWEPEDVIGMQICGLVNKEADKKDPAVFWNNITSFSFAEKQMEALKAEDNAASAGVKKSQPVKTTPDDFEKEMSEKKAKV
jgi:hypothetical protein